MLEKIETRSDAQAVGRLRYDAHTFEADRHQSATAGSLSENKTMPKNLAEGSENAATAGDRSGLVQMPDIVMVDPEIPAQAGEVNGNHWYKDALTKYDAVDLRFSDPLIASIREAHRMRRRWMKARNALILQGKAIARSYVDGGDKKAATDMFNRVAAGKLKPGDEGLVLPLMPFLPAIEAFDAQLKTIEKRLEKMAGELPVAAFVKGVRGFGMGSLAAIVGEAGDLSRYPTVAGVWKRMGLAVINGERQRKCVDADKAIIHGYSPDRRAVMWVIADAMAKHQRTRIDKETGAVKREADLYGKYLEGEKARYLGAGEKPVVAENRAKRHMSKRILRDLTVEWRRIEQGRVTNPRDPDTHPSAESDALEFREAAE